VSKVDLRLQCGMPCSKLEVSTVQHGTLSGAGYLHQSHPDQAFRIGPVGLHPSCPAAHLNAGRVKNGASDSASGQRAINPETIVASLIAGADLDGLTGTAPRLYRPPYGVFSLAALRVVRQRGWTPLLWSKWGRDWERGARPDEIARKATRGLGPGDVVLLHDADSYSSADSWRRTVAALPAVLEAARDTGEPLVSASQST